MKKIIGVQLHAALFVPGLPEFKRTVVPEFYPGIVFIKAKDGSGIECIWKGVEFLLPWVMVQCAVYAKGDANAEKAA